MQTSRVSPNLANGLRDAFLRLVWDQWSQMGVSGSTERRDGWSIDPEALLAFTLRIARHEPRLFDEVLDWMCLNLDLVSAQRLKNLAGDPQTQRLTAAALSWASARSTKVTRHTARRAREVGEPVPLFVRTTGTMQVRKPDPIFLEHGFIRPQLEPSHKSRPPERSAPINLCFRLRDLFGVSARAEVVRVLLLLHGGESRIREIVRAAGYSRQNVHEALNALVSAGVVFMRQRGQRDRSYALDEDRWGAFLALDVDDLPDFVEWPLLLEVLWRLLLWAESMDATERSDYMRASEARQFVADHGIDLQTLGVKLPDARRFLGADYWEPFEYLVLDSLRDKLKPARAAKWGSG
jgi:DNA-binding transcriptional ArsR family regulator